MVGHELDDPASMTRKPDTGNYKARKSDMTFWSRHDTVMNSVGHTDHWSKMKVRAMERAQSALPTVSSYYESLHRDRSGTSCVCLTRSQPRPYSQYRGNLKTGFNERARGQFQYWIIEKPKPTPFGRYAIGSHKTALGIGEPRA